ncbi:MAG: DNA gyrase subunit A [Bacteroidaceae bacterium]|nr:DNA gyrase subunit A [Bacteroidaceae bacterium]
MDETQNLNNDRILKVDLNREMRSSYIDYSMSVIVARALPDVRDGFKPVHRRILYGMMGIGNTHNNPYKKCARIVGEVLGKYHPHGDSSVYGALVRLAQPWNMRQVLVDGQGNFGSVDGDSAAAMRYTEARLTQLGEAMMQDLDKETVDMLPNFDDTLQEPTVMPTRIPNFLVNGATGIAVGMATNVPTHNLGEVIDGCVAYVDNPDISVDELMQYIPAPDFPTGGMICGLQGVRDAYATGRGRVIMRARCEIEDEGTHSAIVITEIPYGVNKAELIKKIAMLSNEKKVDGIANVNDETGREGMRIVVDVKRDANANVVLNKLLKMTDLQCSFSVNNIALVHGRPRILTLKDCIKYFIEHRHDVVIRRTQYDLRKAQERAHILDGLIIASDNIDEVVHIIRASKTPQDAVEGLMKRFELDDIQAKAIVEMRLRQLTGLQQEQLHAEYDELMRKIEYYNQILSDDELCKKVIKDELLEVKEKWAEPRMTEIMPGEADNFNPEDFFANDPMMITTSRLGYIKRTPLSEFHAQERGGVGSKLSSTRDADFIDKVYRANMHDTLLFFTQKGRCYWLKVYEVPEGVKNSKGRAIQNLLNIPGDDALNTMIHVQDLKDEEFCRTHYITFCSKKGIIKKTVLSDYSRPRANGVNAINIREDDSIVSVSLTDGSSEIVIATRNGRAIRFNESKVRAMGRNATGVKGVTLDGADDEVVGMICAWAQDADSTILVLSEKGIGKRSLIEDYRLTGRGGKGVKTINITEKTGKLVAILLVNDANDLVVINKSGTAIRVHVSKISVLGRVTQGVKVINLDKRNDTISSVCHVEKESGNGEAQTTEADNEIDFTQDETDVQTTD